MPSTTFLACISLLGATVLASDIPLTLFTSIDCKTPSTKTPQASIPLEVCAVTPGLQSFHFNSVPCASGGTVKHLLFTDTACAEQASVLDWYKTGSDFDCYSSFQEKTIASVLLTCNVESDDGTVDPGTPVSTTTISVGAVATSPASSGSAAGASASPSASSDAGSGSNSPSSGGGSSSSAGSSSGSSNSASSSSDSTGSSVGSGWNSLPLGARIAIIVVIALVGAGGGGTTFVCCVIKRRASRSGEEAGETPRRERPRTIHGVPSEIAFDNGMLGNRMTDFEKGMAFQNIQNSPPQMNAPAPSGLAANYLGGYGGGGS